jgi:hypothetical protein
MVLLIPLFSNIACIITYKLYNIHKRVLLYKYLIYTNLKEGETKMKKLTKVFFSVILSFALLFSFYSTNSYAANVKTLTTSQQGIREISHGTITVNTNKNNSSSNKAGISVKDDTGSTSTGSVVVSYSLEANNINRTIINSFRIQSITGVPPTFLYISSDLKDPNGDGPYDFTAFSFYHKDWLYGPLLAQWSGSEIFVGNSKTEVVPAETKFWGISCYAYANFIGNDTPITSTWDSPFTAVNRTGNIFPDYTDPWSGKKASDGLRTDWTKVSNPVAYNSGTDRAAAIAGYINLYGDPHYQWSAAYKPNYYEMHHIRPRALGGTNDISNFIPIPYYAHQAISSWFAGYDDPNNQGNDDPSGE